MFLGQRHDDVQLVPFVYRGEYDVLMLHVPYLESSPDFYPAVRSTEQLVFRYQKYMTSHVYFSDAPPVSASVFDMVDCMNSKYCILIKRTCKLDINNETTQII